jgi:opacity protein-like surface antigen
MRRSIHARRAVAGLAALLASGAAAPSAAADFEIVPLAGYRVGGGFRDTAIDAERDIQEHASFGVALNLRRGGDTQWELSFVRANTSIAARNTAPVAPAVPLRVDYLQFGGTYFFAAPGAGGLQPYVVGGFGVTRFSPTRSGLDNRTAPSLNLGAGLRLPLAERVTVRLEVRGYFTLLDTDGSIFCKSDIVDAACSIEARARGMVQGEALLGVAVRL